MRTIDLRGRVRTPAELLAVVPRATAAKADAAAAADGLVRDVRAHGATALRAQADRFDDVRDHAIVVPRPHLVAALAGLDANVRSALETSIERVRVASEAQVPEEKVTVFGPGALVRQRWQPVQRAGVYIPGGKAVYPSSVVMNIVPALVAGVAGIALASPPQRDANGRVHPTILAAAELLGITEVYAMGGAGAIAALAFGVAEIGLDPVDVVTGPGNNFVAAAKRIVSGEVGIDAEAGATEILISADASADPRLIAFDLVSQAEHDEQAAAILVTDDPHIAEQTARVVGEIAAHTRHADRVRTALSGPQSAIVLVDDAAAAAAFSNAYAPEHLALHLKDAHEATLAYHTAGAVFVGPAAPVSLGDYLAGSNHVLPTGGSARYASGLGAHTFLRPQQVIEYDRDGLRAVADQIVSLAHAENLPAHGEAVSARFTP